VAEPKRISLALQGGGSHGAFQWGVLDRLLEEERLEVGAVTSASAGAFNAVAFASGLLRGGRAGATAELEGFWRAVNQSGGRNIFGDHELWNAFTPWLKETPMYQWWETAALSVSPYDNPWSHNPLRAVLESRVDFAALRACSPVKLKVSATSVRTGEARVFNEAELTADVILASACLPQLFQAVRIDGEDYWDGGYVANPALWPLFYEDAPEDLLVVHINPLTREQTPRRSAEIMDRLNEISFNASLIAELRAIGFVNQLLDDDLLRPEARGRFRRIHVHAIKADSWLGDLSLASKFETEWGFLTDLRARGRRAAERWLNRCFEHLGECSTVSVRDTFLADVPTPGTQPAEVPAE
jgi:NTE family protein